MHWIFFYWRLSLSFASLEPFSPPLALSRSRPANAQYVGKVVTAEIVKGATEGFGGEENSELCIPIAEEGRFRGLQIFEKKILSGGIDDACSEQECKADNTSEENSGDFLDCIRRFSCTSLNYFDVTGGRWYGSVGETPASRTNVGERDDAVLPNVGSAVW